MNASRPVAVAALVASLAFVFADQARDAGFRAGHRGWVSAHTLAIAQKATARNGFVGYAVSLATPASRELYYFDRYPVFFAAALHAAQTVVPLDKEEQIQVARQVMNLVYALTLVVAVLLLLELGLPLEAAIAVAALAGAGYTMVESRDMVHFDQPALLGIVALLWAIAGWYQGRGSRRVFLAAAAAVMAGRGYASFAVLGLWWVFETVRIVLGGGDHGANQAATARAMPAKILRSVPTRACVLAIAIGTACLGYNVVMEARMRGVPLAEVGIIGSAERRLSLDERFNEENEKHLTWGSFLEGQAQNLARSVVPWTRRDPLSGHHDTGPVVAALIAVIALGLAATRHHPQRIVWLLACLAGPLWLVVMRNLAAFHPYTAIFLFPLCLTFFAALVRILPARLGLVAALAACAVLVWSTDARNRDLAREGRELRQESGDMERVAHALHPHDAVAIDGRLFRGVPFALGFYLPDHDVVVEGPATLVLTRNTGFDGENLTPRNLRIFLFRPAGRYHARSLLARHLPGTRPSRTRARAAGDGAQRGR